MIRLTRLQPEDRERYALEAARLRHRIQLELTSEPERRLADLFRAQHVQGEPRTAG